MKRSLGVWTAAAIVVLSACAETPRDLTLPLDQNGPGPDVVRAEEHLLTECLAAYGVTAGDLRRRHPNAAYLGWLGEPETGYHATSPGEYVLTGDAEAVYLGTVESHAGRAVPGGGCRQAVRDLLRPPRRDPLDALAQEAAGAAGRDPRMADADGRWAGCMREKGYAYPRPDAAAADPRWAVTAAVEDPPEDGGPAELATAADDHECREESGWYDVRHEVYADHQNRVITAGGPAMADVKAYTTELEAAAAKVLAGDHTRTW